MSLISRNISGPQVKKEIMSIVDNLGLLKSQVKISCSNREINVSVIDVIEVDKLAELRNAINSHYEYYNHNGSDQSADYPDYRTNLTKYNYIYINWDFDSVLIQNFIDDIKTRLISVIGDNRVIPYAAGVAIGYPISAYDIARMAMDVKSLRKITSDARVDYHGKNEVFIS